jgi:hypothetical protein
MGTDDSVDERRIPSNTLETLRGILISSLSRENIGNIDVQPSLGRRRKVTFQELRNVHGECYNFRMSWNRWKYARGSHFAASLLRCC